MTLVQDVMAAARALGFGRVGVVPAGAPLHLEAFEAWLAAGFHGEMAYMAKHAALRADPARLDEAAHTIIVVCASYHRGVLPAASVNGSWGRFARYAWATDYHDVIKSRLYELDAFIRRRSGRSTNGKVCVDSAPLLERDFAAQAALGFIGRNSCLIAPGLGSWTFLGALLVPESLEAAAATAGELTSPQRLGSSDASCGRCTRCLDACPTGALVAPYVLDARRCISYLTIELRGPIPSELRPLMGNWVFGCDVCQEVCPYNRTAPKAVWPALAPDRTRAVLSLAELLALDEDGFRARFRGAPVLRAKRRGLVRNACVGAGNSRDPALLPVLEKLTVDPEPLVRGHAAWAIGRIGAAKARKSLANALAGEADPSVRSELEAALAG